MENDGLQIAYIKDGRYYADPAKSPDEQLAEYNRLTGQNATGFDWYTTLSGGPNDGARIPFESSTKGKENNESLMPRITLEKNGSLNIQAPKWMVNSEEMKKFTDSIKYMAGQSMQSQSVQEKINGLFQDTINNAVQYKSVSDDLRSRIGDVSDKAIRTGLALSNSLANGDGKIIVDQDDTMMYTGLGFLHSQLYQQEHDGELPSDTELNNAIKKWGTDGFDVKNYLDRLKKLRGFTENKALPIFAELNKLAIGEIDNTPDMRAFGELVAGGLANVSENNQDYKDLLDRTWLENWGDFAAKFNKNIGDSFLGTIFQALGGGVGTLLTGGEGLEKGQEFWVSKRDYDNLIKSSAIWATDFNASDWGHVTGEISGMVGDIVVTNALIPGTGLGATGRAASIIKNITQNTFQSIALSGVLWPTSRILKGEYDFNSENVWEDIGSEVGLDLLTFGGMHAIGAAANGGWRKIVDAATGGAATELGTRISRGIITGTTKVGDIKPVRLIMNKLDNLSDRRHQARLSAIEAFNNGDVNKARYFLETVDNRATSIARHGRDLLDEEIAARTPEGLRVQKTSEDLMNRLKTSRAQIPGFKKNTQATRIYDVLGGYKTRAATMPKEYADVVEAYGKTSEIAMEITKVTDDIELTGAQKSSRLDELSLAEASNRAFLEGATEDQITFAKSVSDFNQATTALAGKLGVIDEDLIKFLKDNPDADNYVAMQRIMPNQVQVITDMFTDSANKGILRGRRTATLDDTHRYMDPLVVADKRLGFVLEAAAQKNMDRFVFEMLGEESVTKMTIYSEADSRRYNQLHRIDGTQNAAAHKAAMHAISQADMNNIAGEALDKLKNASLEQADITNSMVDIGNGYIRTMADNVLDNKNPAFKEWLKETALSNNTSEDAIAMSLVANNPNARRKIVDALSTNIGENIYKPTRKELTAEFIRDESVKAADDLGMLVTSRSPEIQDMINTPDGALDTAELTNRMMSTVPYFDKPTLSRINRYYGSSYQIGRFSTDIQNAAKTRGYVSPAQAAYDAGLNAGNRNRYVTELQLRQYSAVDGIIKDINGWSRIDYRWLSDQVRASWGDDIADDIMNLSGKKDNKKKLISLLEDHRDSIVKTGVNDFIRDIKNMNYIFNEADAYAKRINTSSRSASTRLMIEKKRAKIIENSTVSKAAIDDAVKKIFDKAIDAENSLASDPKLHKLFAEKRYLVEKLNGAKREVVGQTAIHQIHNGVDVYYHIADPAVARMLDNPYKYTKKNGVAYKLMSGQAKVFTTLTTGVNPIGFLRNTIRDSYGAVINGGFEGATRQLLVDPRTATIARIKDYMPEAVVDQVDNIMLRRAGRRAAVTADMSAIDIPFNTMSENSFSKAMSNNGHTVKKVTDQFRRPLQAEDRILRQKVFDSAFIDSFDMQKRAGRAIDINIALEHATFMANNATTNFAHGISFMQDFARTVPYLTSAVNGTRSFARLFQLDPIGVSMRIFGFAATPVFYLTMNNLKNDKNKAVYETIPEWKRDSSLIFITDSGEIYTYDIPQEIRGFTNVVRNIVETTNDVNPQSFGEMAVQFFADLSPIDLTGFTEENASLQKGIGRVASQFSPQAASFAYTMMSGTDLYTGQEIFSPESPTLEFFGDKQAQEIAHNAGNAMFGSTWNQIIGILDSTIHAGKKNRTRDLIEEISYAFFGSGYNDANAKFQQNIAQLEVEKQKVFDQMAKIDNELYSMTAEEQQAARIKVNELKQEFGLKVKTVLEKYSALYQITGDFDEAKRSQVISLLNFTRMPGLSASLSPTMVADAETMAGMNAQQIEQAGARDARALYNELGLPVNTGQEQFGYYNNEGQFVLPDSFNWQLVNDRYTGGQEQMEADLKRIISGQSVQGTDFDMPSWKNTMREYSDLYYQYIGAKKWDDADKIVMQYLRDEFIPRVDVLVEKYGAQQITRSSAILDELDNMLFAVPSAYTNNDNGRYLSKNSRLNRVKGFSQAFIRDMYGMGPTSQAALPQTEAAAKQVLDSINRKLDAGDVGAAKVEARRLRNDIAQGRRIVSQSDMQAIENILVNG